MIKQKTKQVKPTLLSIVFLLLNTVLFAQVKEKTLSTGFYKVVEKSSYKVIDPQFQETLFLDTIPVCGAKDYKKVNLIFSQAGMPEIEIQLGEQGTEKFAKATKDYIGKRIAIITNGKLLMAPIVHSEISTGRLNITSNLSVPELEGIIDRIRKESNIKPKSKEEEQKERAILQACFTLDSALIQADTAQLEKLVHRKLSLGHYNGLIETKQELLQHLSNDYLKYNNIEERGYNDVQFVDNIATVRRQIKVNATLQNRPFDITLKVLETWIMEDNNWKLLSRQSVKKQ